MPPGSALPDMFTHLLWAGCVEQSWALASPWLVGVPKLPLKSPSVALPGS